MDRILIRFILLTNQIQPKDSRKGLKNTSQPTTQDLAANQHFARKTSRQAFLEQL